MGDDRGSNTEPAPDCALARPLPTSIHTCVHTRRRIGVDDAGLITEACVLNIGVVTQAGTLCTPPFNRIMKGTTVRLMMELASVELSPLLDPRDYHGWEPQIATLDAAPAPFLQSHSCSNLYSHRRSHLCSHLCSPLLQVGAAGGAHRRGEEREGAVSHRRCNATPPRPASTPPHTHRPAPSPSPWLRHRPYRPETGLPC